MKHWNNCFGLLLMSRQRHQHDVVQQQAALALLDGQLYVMPAIAALVLVGERVRAHARLGRALAGKAFPVGRGMTVRCGIGVQVHEGADSRVRPTRRPERPPR